LEDTVKVTTRKAALGGLAMFGAAVLLAGCGSAPEDSGSTDGGEAASDFLPCMVSDAGGFDDKSFNQLGFEGLTADADELGVEPVTVQSDAETDYAPNLTNLVDQGCNLIVTVGFALASAAGESAEANPDIDYVSIDDTVDLDFDGQTDFDNIKPIIFDTAQAAFLAGYAAADYSKTGIVGTFGGLNFPTVSIFMDGFAQGVEYHNQEKGTNVQVLGWDRAAQDGLFTGGFEANDTARNTAQGLIDQNVDVLLPVGGPIYQSAAAAIRDSGREIAMIGVDADFTQTDPSVADLMLTSILKGIDVGTKEAVLAAGNGEFDNTPFIGTLENEGVGIAPFHDFESTVSSSLQGELDDLKAAIIAGDIKVESYLAASE
jgi:basic membrane protein A